MNTIFRIAIVGLTLSLIASEVQAQRGRGGGGRGGGGRSVGGSSMGARPAPSPSFNRSPSMSRPAVQPQNRSFSQPKNRAPQAGNLSRPSNAGRSNQALAGRSGISNSNNSPRVSNSQAGKMNFKSQQSYQRPNQQQLGNFLNMPQTSGRSSFGSNSGKPSQLPAGGNSKSITTDRGTTITTGGRSGSGTTSGGTTVGGAVGGIKVDTAGGKSFGKVSGVGGASDGTNSAIRGGSATGASDGRGNAAVNVRGGYADSSGYRQGGSVTATQNRYGRTTVDARGGYGYGNGTGRTGSVTAVRGPAGNVISAGRGAAYVNGQFVGGNTWGAVNGSYTHWNQFGPRYPVNYPNCWWPGKWAVATTAWATATYVVAGSYCGCSSAGTYYDYGENVTYQEGVVYQDEQPVATAEEYYDQAEQIAASGEETANEDWMPLGVFALVSEGETSTDKVVQLALNKDGVIRGNYQDQLADTVIPVTGSVDRETQRVALKLAGNENLVVETGLYNLTNDEVPVLLHFGPDRQEARVLARLQNPELENSN
ncbi:MAG: hypothetical protein ACI814_004256 [Mariniblastus sp.]|jgi:hypothetical protein